MGFLFSLMTTLVSIFVIFNANRASRERYRWLLRGVAGLIGSLALLNVLTRFVVVVSAGEVGVVDFLGNVAEKPLNPGIHILNPFSRIVPFSTRLMNVQETIEATSQEGLAFNLNVSLQYRIEPSKVPEVYQKIGTDSTEIVISQFRSIVREVTASYPAEAVYSTKRQEVANQIRQRLIKQLNPLGFIVEEALLRELQLPEKLQTAIQDKLKAEQDNQRMKFVLEKERQEAERKRIEAKGQSDSQKILSEGLSDQVLRLRTIEAMEKLGSSQGSKTIILGGSRNGTPILLQP